MFFAGLVALVCLCCAPLAAASGEGELPTGSKPESALEIEIRRADQPPIKPDGAGEPSHIYPRDQFHVAQ